jgi:hypothetical protein
MASAATACIVAVTWEYRSKVMPIWLWPSRSLTILGVQVTRLVEDFLGARLPDAGEERLLELPSGVPVTRNIRTAYAGEQPVEVMDTISNGEVVSYRFEIKV